MLDYRADALNGALVNPHKRGPSMLSDSEINEVLQIYREQYRLVKVARFEFNEATFELKRLAYPFTKEPIFEYITAPSATLYIAQLCYVYVFGQIVLNASLARALPSRRMYLNCRDESRLRIASSKFRFLKSAPNATDIVATCRCIRMRSTSSGIFLDLRGELAHVIEYQCLCIIMNPASNHDLQIAKE